MKLHVAVKRGTPVREVGRERDTAGATVAFCRAPSKCTRNGRAYVVLITRISHIYSTSVVAASWVLCRLPCSATLPPLPLSCL